MRRLSVHQIHVPARSDAVDVCRAMSGTYIDRRRATPMGRRKTTMYVDEDVLTATKVLAAGRGDSESQVVEDALRAYLDAGRLEVAREELQALMDRLRLAGRGDLDDDQAMAIAVEEVRAVRASRRSDS
jgi:hypothetical protein